LAPRRGEVVALQWDDIELDVGMVRLDENYVRTSNGMSLKDTKTHQMRRVSIDAPTVELLRHHREDSVSRLALLGLQLTGHTWLFSATPDMSRPRDPASLTRRYGRLMARLGIDTVLKELRVVARGLVLASAPPVSTGARIAYSLASDVDLGPTGSWQMEQRRGELREYFGASPNSAVTPCSPPAPSRNLCAPCRPTPPSVGTGDTSLRWASCWMRHTR
jgi:hypothetical protein